MLGLAAILPEYILNLIVECYAYICNPDFSDCNVVCCVLQQVVLRHLRLFCEILQIRMFYRVFKEIRPLMFIMGIACVCDVLRPINKTERLVLLPKGRSKTFRYDIFGQVPISWQISIGTNADVALIYGYAEWDSY